MADALSHRRKRDLRKMNGDTAAPSAKDSIMAPTIAPVARVKGRGRSRGRGVEAGHGRGHVVQGVLGQGAPVENVHLELTHEEGPSAGAKSKVPPGVVSMPQNEGLANLIVTRGSMSHLVNYDLVSPLFEGVADRSLHILNLIYTYQPQTFDKLMPNSPARVQFLNLLADLMHNWIYTKVEDITEVDIVDLNRILLIWEGSDLNVTWLKNRLQEIDSKIKFKRLNDRLNVVNNEKDAMNGEMENLSKRVQQMKDDCQVNINNLVNTCANIDLNWNKSVMQNLIGDEFS